ncbi:hypothetical protein EXIGLDRAFT_253351 [Exidia glandulosa HHB12029]|uniref:Uncharacterized protein n=1 Tax=Exidia glandulosa HHB12029 TaxID=1314781 RepID=A0A165DXI6_EXIGL|nr:hypothetical protein EXIGLDRAFT_253351 [Exidia glandulosa HHB12029]
MSSRALHALGRRHTNSTTTRTWRTRGHRLISLRSLWLAIAIPHVPHTLSSAQRDTLVARRSHGWPTVAGCENVQHSAQTDTSYVSLSLTLSVYALTGLDRRGAATRVTRTNPKPRRRLRRTLPYLAPLA